MFQPTRRAEMRIHNAWSAVVLAGVLAGVSPAGAAQPAAEDLTKHPGYVDFGTVNLFGSKEADVEIFLEQNLINMVGAFVKNEDPEFANMLAKIKQIRVQSFAIDPDKLEAIEKKTEDVSKKLESQGWATLVKVRDRKQGEQTFVYMKWIDNKVQGLVVMNVDPRDAASFVNIVGEIDPEQVGKLQHKFDIRGLDSLESHEWKKSSSKGAKRE
jgi:hypothetical protein